MPFSPNLFSDLYQNNLHYFLSMWPYGITVVDTEIYQVLTNGLDHDILYIYGPVSTNPNDLVDA